MIFVSFKGTEWVLGKMSPMNSRNHLEFSISMIMREVRTFNKILTTNFIMCSTSNFYFSTHLFKE